MSTSRDLGGFSRSHERAVLFFQQNQIAGWLGARISARVVDEHQREQAEGFGVSREQRAEQPRQTDCLGAEFPANQRVAGRCGIALVKNQIEHGLHLLQAFGQRVQRRDLVGNMRLRDF